MRVLLSLGKSAGRGPWLLATLLLLALGWLRPQAALASHIRAGDIQAKEDTVGRNPNRIFFKFTMYRDNGFGEGTNPFDQKEVTIFFGDGTRQDGIPLASRVTVGATDIITFNFEHTYGGPKTYEVSFVGENRNAGVLNMSNSDGQTFYVSTTIIINPAYSSNHSPVLRAPAVDKGAVGQVFLHNPAGYDADGDSLTYELVKCQQVAGGVPASESTNLPNHTTCLNYVYPDDVSIAANAVQVPYTGVPIGQPGQKAFISQDPRTGQITWNAPAKAGFYNIAFKVHEYRRSTSGFFREIGVVIRDMQIIVAATKNLPPKLTVPPDLCVIAGQKVTLNVSATDGSGPDAPATAVKLTAYSGTLPPATFQQTTTGTTSRGVYTWDTKCSDVSDQPYLVVFKAEDTGPNPPVASNPVLVDIQPVRITVVGPPPQNLRVVQTAAGGVTNVVSWDSYVCQNATQMLIYRKENPSGFNPGPCETGIPPSAGYTQIGSVPITTTTFADNQGLARGKTYCYRIYATYPRPAGGASIASAEACVTSNGRSAVLTNVDVNTTNATTGQITVKWTQPRPDVGSFVSPTYTLSRAAVTGATNTTFKQVVQITNLADTTYLDRGLNTLDSQYVYRLTFSNIPRAGSPAVEEVALPATSVRASLVPDGIAKTITVNWAYSVPWDNSRQPSHIYRRDPGSTTFNEVGTATPGATSGTFLDTKGLVAGQEYCYYVQTTGQYPGIPYLSNLLNKSQQICATLLDVPCTPVLSLQVTNCDSLSGLQSYVPVNQTYDNRLRWTIGSLPTGCATNAVSYNVFRADTEGGPYVLIGTTPNLTYLDRGQPRPTYCYKVQAAAANGQLSALSNSACQTDCVFFILPNIFIPGSTVKDNQVFRPKVSSPLKHTHIQIFNRWGRKVYEGDQDPYINWTGGGIAGESNTSGLVSGGIYYYLADVEFADAAQTKRTFKGWVELIR